MTRNEVGFVLGVVGILALLIGAGVFGYGFIQAGQCNSYVVSSVPVEAASGSGDVIAFAELSPDQQRIVKESLERNFAAAEPLPSAAAIEGRSVRYDGTVYAFDLSYRACGTITGLYQILGGVLIAGGGSYLFLSNRIR